LTFSAKKRNQLLNSQKSQAHSLPTWMDWTSIQFQKRVQNRRQNPIRNKQDQNVRRKSSIMRKQLEKTGI
jgi:hypothetical protein